jgi:UDP-N-acetylglucosamine acyltransferase
MKTLIHDSAVVSPEAQIAEGVEIGPYAIVGPHARIGKGTRLFAHAVVEGHTTVGERCQIYYGACLGAPPQDKKFRAAVSYLKIGDDNVIR